MKKSDIPTIAEKNRIVDSIIGEIAENESFLLVGHKNPDEDCVASLVAFALLLSKFQKRITISTCGSVQDQLQYLLHICTYNLIGLLEGCDETPSDFSTVVILDTPKPSMIDSNEVIDRLLADPAVRKIEIDHHLQADALYSGDPGFRLVANASSTCELIGFLALKIAKKRDLLDRFEITELFSRNLALAILTGIIGDSKMGKFLKTNRERWYYRTFSSMFEKMLYQKTLKDSANFSSMEEIFKVIQSLSAVEKECLERVMKKRQKNRSLNLIVLDAAESAELDEKYGNDVIIAVTKAAADKLAEDNGRLGLVVYYDGADVSNFIQFRLRRSPDFSVLDLRTILDRFKIANGGGHPGAIGFRFEKGSVEDLDSYVDKLAAGIEGMIEGLA